jgi:DNA primase
MLNQDLILQAKSADLLQIAGSRTSLKHVASSGGGEWAGPCPIPGCRCDQDGFRIQPQQKRWLCRNCTDGKWQDAIALIMRLEQLPFSEAVRRLTGGFPASAPVPDTRPIESLSLPPAPAWQKHAKEVFLRAQEVLWSRAGEQAVNWDAAGTNQYLRLSPLEWLRERGLKDETIKKFQLGFIPRDVRDAAQKWGLTGKPAFLSRGITLPGRVGEICWYLKIRRPQGRPKYLQVRGSRPALFMANALSAHETILLCEGEFDALLLAQEAGDLTGIATLGSASQHLDLTAWGWYLLNACRFLVAYDIDGKSEAGARDLLTIRHSIRANVPQLRPQDKDLTDFYQSGGDLRAWVKSSLNEKGSES